MSDALQRPLAHIVVSLIHGGMLMAAAAQARARHSVRRVVRGCMGAWSGGGGGGNVGCEWQGEDARLKRRETYIRIYMYTFVIANRHHPWPYR